MDSMSLIVRTAIFLILLVLPRPAAADPERQRPCKADEDRLCAEVPYGRGRVRACLEGHKQDLSPACKAVLDHGLNLTPIEIPLDSGENDIRLTGWLATPKDRSHYGAVVILHGCNGLDAPGWQHAFRWAEWFHGQGLATLILDSFTRRELSNVCGAGTELPARERVRDLIAAKNYLTQRGEIEPDQIAAIGFSHGGWTVLEAAREGERAEFAALIALYPSCKVFATAKIEGPLLILIGDRDDWTPSEPCRRLAEQNEAQNVRIKVYPGATHSFDAVLPPRQYFEHLLRYDKAADEDAHVEIFNFLKQQMRQGKQP
jgi:dienelactone hydrolase